MNEALQRLADAAGIEREYWDALGTHRPLDDETARAVLVAMGIDVDDPDAVLRALHSSAARSPPGSTDGRCWIPDDLRNGGRLWGVSVQLYALRSSRNWGIGDFTDLVGLARIAADAGASMIGLNPLHARHLSRPDAASPYWPSSRRFLDVLYIDVEAIPEFDACAEARELLHQDAFRNGLHRLRRERLVDYAEVTIAKLRVLRMIHRRFRERAADQRRDAYRQFCERHGASLERFAEFEALRLHLSGEPAHAACAASSWDRWPAEWHDPTSPAFGHFRRDLAVEIDLQKFLQFEAGLQLERAATSARDAGLALSLYRDLAVGAADDSAEAWADPALIARGISIGAPPDHFSRHGQNWGLPPMNPRTLAERDHRPFAELIAANMRGAGALRIDHVMALARLFWIPSGMSGTRGCYVRNDFDALAAIVAAESNHHRCMVIGEDLGSVPDGLRERLSERGFLSYRVLFFERWWSGDGSFKRPRDYPAQALAMVATHDMPTIADWWKGTDIDRRASLDLYPEPHLADEDRGRRHAEREGVLGLLREIGLEPVDRDDCCQIADALHAAIARTPSMLAVVQLDDVLCEVEPTNIPGTTDAYPNWRRKVSVPVEALAGDERLMRTARIMRDAGRAAVR